MYFIVQPCGSKDFISVLVSVFLRWKKFWCTIGPCYRKNFLNILTQNLKSSPHTFLIKLCFTKLFSSYICSLFTLIHICAHFCLRFTLSPYRRVKPKLPDLVKFRCFQLIKLGLLYLNSLILINFQALVLIPLAFTVRKHLLVGRGH